MNAIAYLTLTKLKNMLKNLIKTPSKLIYSIFLIAFIVFMFWSANRGEPVGAMRDMGELYALVLAFYSLYFIINALGGVSNGASFFSMPDVNLLFCSPVSPKRVLIYGLIRQLGTSVLFSVVLVYQYGWISQTYGVRGGGMAAIIAGFILVIFCSQLFAMVVYSICSGSERRQRIVKLVFAAVSVAAIAVILYPALRAEDKLAAIVGGANSGLLDFFPVSGWLRAAAVGVMTGNGGLMLLGLGLTGLFVAAFLILITKLDADYYEDVLQATETAHSGITAKKEGRLQESAPKNIKVKRTGIGRGNGASAIYFKHRLENSRARVFIFDAVTLLLAVVSIVFAYFMREAGILAGFAFAVYMSIFGSFTGRWARELLQPYVYLIPESSFKKLIMTCGETIERSAVQALVIMIPIGLITGASAGTIAAAAFAHFGFSLLFIASNILTERLFGSTLIKSLQMIFYFIILILLALPGLILAAVFALPLGMWMFFASVFLWNALVSAAVVLLCRNILSIAELNNK